MVLKKMPRELNTFKGQMCLYLCVKKAIREHLMDSGVIN